MNDIIRKRKAIRKYEPTALGEDALTKIQEKIDSLRPLHPDIRCSVKIVTRTKPVLSVSAPHFLTFRSEEKDGYLENIGFLGQQMGLFFSESGYGTCWLGFAKPEKQTGGDFPFIICKSFGLPAEPLYRELSAFKRKPLSEISEGSDPRLEAARLAPSGMNFQKWYFIAENGKIHCYRKKIKGPLGPMMAKYGCIDLGIAICHIAEESETFSFVKDSAAPERKGLIYAGTVC